MSSSSLSVKSDMAGPLCGESRVARGKSAPLPNPPATRFVRAEQGISPRRHGEHEEEGGDKGRKCKDLGRGCGERRKSWKKVVRFRFWSHGARTNAVMRGTATPPTAPGSIGGTILITPAIETACATRPRCAPAPSGSADGAGFHTQDSTIHNFKCAEPRPCVKARKGRGTVRATCREIVYAFTEHAPAVTSPESGELGGRCARGLDRTGVVRHVAVAWTGAGQRQNMGLCRCRSRDVDDLRRSGDRWAATIRTN